MKEIIIAGIWPGTILIIVLLFKSEISSFLKDLGEIKTQWFELKKIKKETEELREVIKNSLSTWIHFIHANQLPKGSNEQIDVSKKFNDEINKMADMILEKDEKIAWAKQMGFVVTK